MSEDNMFENNGQSGQNSDQQQGYTQAPQSGYTQGPSYQQDYNQGGYNQGGGYNNYGPDESNGLGIASMICGIVAIPIMCCTNVGSAISIVLGIIAVVLGIIQIKSHEKRGMAIAGIVCGAIAVVCASLLAIGAWALNSGFYDEIMTEYYRSLLQ